MSVDLSRRGFIRGGLVAGAGAGLLNREGQAAAPKDRELTLPVSCTVNGQATQILADTDLSTVDALRDGLGLTGTKRSCGQGTCGACTVLVDGRPHVSCLLPAVALDGREVTTVEGLPTGEDGLHPVQRAFLHEDALQCGFCTPGFVVEAIPFYDAWRASGQEGEPTREAVQEALAGHLCRCGAYESIFAAVIGACAGRFEEAGSAGDFARVEGAAKVTGTALYTVDIRMDGLLEGAVLRSPHAHARLISLDTSAALAMPGVKGLVRAVEDGGRVRYAGQEVAAIAATDREAARLAVRALVAEWEVLPAVTSPEAAQAEGAPLVYEETRNKAPNAAEGFKSPGGWKGNVRGPVGANIFANPGRARRTVAAAKGTELHHSVEVWTQVQSHTTLEPHATLARFNEDGSLEVWASTQGCNELAEDLAEIAELPRAKVRVHNEHIGGAFGGKAGLKPDSRLAVALARETHAPVRISLDRPEEIAVGALRPGEHIQLELAMDEAGTISAVTADCHGDAGVAVGNGAAPVLRMLYARADADVADYDVITHTPPGAPFRGPGGPPAVFAMESAVDEIAHARGEDPVALRRRWDNNKARARLYEIVDQVPLWKDRPAPQTDKGRFRRGIGLAAAGWFGFLDPNAQVQLEATNDGFVASLSTQDMGNGARGMIAAVISEIFQLPIGDIDVKMGDSTYVHGPLAAGSRVTPSVAPAARDAAHQLLEVLKQVADTELLLTNISEAPGGLTHDGGFISWSKLLSRIDPVSVVGRRPRDPGGYLIPLTISNTKASKAWPGSLQVIQVEVDTRLGRTRVLDSWTGMAVGRIISPRLALSQVQGGVVQGLSYALYEERRLDLTHGWTMTANLEDYRIMGPGDLPHLTVHFDETPLEAMAGGSTGLSELSTLAPAAATANAVWHATGWRPRALPLRIDRVLGGLS